MKQQARIEIKKEESDHLSNKADQKKQTHATNDYSRPLNKKAKWSQKDSKTEGVDTDAITGAQVMHSLMPNQVLQQPLHPVIPQDINTGIIVRKQAQSPSK